MRNATLILLALMGCDDDSGKRVLDADGGEQLGDAGDADADPLAPDADPLAPDAAGADALVASFCDGTWSIRVTTTEIGNCFDPNDIRTYQVALEVAGSTVAGDGFEVLDATLTPSESACSWTTHATGLGFTFELYPADAGDGAILGTGWVHDETKNCMQRANLDGAHD
jgi:hypothetical protein